MSKDNNLLENPEEVKNKFEHDENMKKIREEVLKKLNDYRKTMNYMAADAPIGILCLNPAIEKILIANGFLRVYDVFDVDFTKIKGFGVARCRDLATSLDQFFSML